MIIDQILVTPMAVFCYLVTDEGSKKAVLIDPAGDHDLIFEKIEARGAVVQWVINTHGHFDHTSGNEYVIARTGAGLMIHEADVSKLGSLTNRFFSRTIGGKKSPGPSVALNGGDTVQFGSERLSVMHTPGHSEGSICLYSPGNVFTGDTLFTEGMGRTDLMDGSYDKIMDSIVNKILTLPDDTVIWPGHHYGRSASSTVKEQKRFYL
ncbi:MAG: MBL fold metallo-hydrolase [Spirochaetes bacterium]|jgi:glyoxylase-like metal-dependent hydrolase (beta-lactamase superfamily II)|nr:MBL fold metallo-hydrolase [Spirochaetota bacterium]